MRADEDELWWVSFATETESLGVVIIPREQAEDIVALTRRLWMLGLNPGGSVMANWAPAWEFREGGDAWCLQPDNQGRLIDRAEMDRLGYPVYGDVNPQGFDREGFEKDMDAHMLEQDDA